MAIGLLCGVGGLVEVDVLTVDECEASNGTVRWF